MVGAVIVQCGMSRVLRLEQRVPNYKFVPKAREGNSRLHLWPRSVKFTVHWPGSSHCRFTDPFSNQFEYPPGVSSPLAKLPRRGKDVGCATVYHG